jgi:superfamily II DNA/RNA helicase
MTFEELQLAPPILKALALCGHHSPTAVQELAIPKVMAGHDLIASAQTGTGKTAAFVLPALQRLLVRPSDRKLGLRVLVMTPTRELADQITQVARTYGKYLDVHSVAIVGGMPFGDQIRALSQIPDMIVGTPGRLIDHIWRGRIDLSHVELLVIDEADRMLEMGFIGDVEFMFEAMPENCQTLLFAATMGNAAAKLAQKYLKNPERIEVAPGKITHDEIEQRLHIADSVQHKTRLLHRFCTDTTVTRAIIFSATKRGADSLARALNTQGHPAAALHADMTQSARNRTVMDMRRGKIRLLVATDVAARGLDIDGISHVINFDLPRSAEDYVNRIGRTGRAGATGIAISLASRGDLPYLDRIEGYLGHNLPVRVIPGLEPDHPIRRQKGRQGDDQQAPATGSRSPFNGKKSDSRSYGHERNDDDGKRRSRGTPRTAPQNVAPTVEHGTDRPGHAQPPGRKRKTGEKHSHAESGTGKEINVFGLPRHHSFHGRPKQARPAAASQSRSGPPA